MLEYWEEKRRQAIIEKNTLKFFKIIKHKKRVCGYVKISDRNDLFGPTVFAHNYMKIGDDKIFEMFTDVDRSLDELKENYDLVVIFKHIGNHATNETIMEMIDLNTMIATLYTKTEFVENDDTFKFLFFFDDVVYKHEQDENNETIKVPKEKYKHLF